MKTTKSNKDKGTTLKAELIGHIGLYVALSIISQLAFYRENIVVVQRFLGGFYWLFVLPGATLLLAWGNHWDFVERAVAGTVLALAVTSTASYYLGIVGLPVGYHGLLFTPMLVVIGIIGYLRRK